MIKLVASDIDGTLVPEGTTSIDPEFYEIIRKLKKKGILFAGASGRQYSSMRALLDPVFDDIIFISGNGTNIMRKGEKLYSMGMNQADVAKLIVYMRTLPDCIFTASTLDGIYYEQQDEDFERLQMEGYHNQIHLVKDVTKEPVEIQKLRPVLPESRYRGDRGRCQRQGGRTPSGCSRQESAGSISWIRRQTREMR